jgi:hypothetical protein
VRVESLLQREGRGPVERTGPIQLPGRRSRHAAGRRAPADPAAADATPPPGPPVVDPAWGPPVDPEADTDPLPALGAPPATAATVARAREPRPTPPVGTPVPALARARPPRPDPPRRAPDDPESVPAQTAAVAERPRWWSLRRRGPRSGVPSRRWFGRWSRATVLIGLAALAAALGAAGIAVAAWLGTGSGKPGVTAGTALLPTTTAVAGSAVTSGLLTPGVSGTAVVTVTNPNPYKVKIVTISPNGAATGTGGTGTCTTTGVTFTAQQPGTTLTAGASTTLTLAGAVGMSTASDTGCQGATFTVPVTVAVVSTP